LRVYWTAAAIAVISLVACAAAVADDAVTFRAADQPALRALAIGEFAPGTLARGAIEAQTPAMRVGVTGVTLEVSTGNDTDCGVGLDTGAVLARDGSAAPIDGCLFLANLTLATERGPMAVEGQCDDWRAGVSLCWIEGEAGQFRLLRPEPGGNRLQLQFGAGGAADQTASIALAAPAAEARPSARGIMLDGIYDDAGRAVSDRWLLLPPGVVTLDLAR